MAISKEAQDRKDAPIYTGFIVYFHDAIREVARLSKIANDQHNPGTLTHWDKSKSKDDADAMMRHIVDGVDEFLDTDGVPHDVKVAWRGMAVLQRRIDADKKK